MLHLVINGRDEGPDEVAADGDHDGDHQQHLRTILKGGGYRLLTDLSALPTPPTSNSVPMKIMPWRIRQVAEIPPFSDYPHQHRIGYLVHRCEYPKHPFRLR